AGAEHAAVARIDSPVRGHFEQRAVEPAGRAGAGFGEAALQYVLAVEMRALARRRRGRVHDGGLLRLVEPVQVGNRRVERKEAVERQRRRLALEGESAITAQADPV